MSKLKIDADMNGHVLNDKEKQTQKLIRKLIASQGRIHAFIIILLASAGQLMAQNKPFIDPMFGIVDLQAGQLRATSPNNNIIYDKGAINGAGAGEMDLQLDLYHPSGTGLPAKLPGVVLIHGGGFSSGNKEDYAMRTIAIEYARRGYIAVSIGYRLNGTQPDERNPSAAINDATKAVKWMIAQAVPGGFTERLMTDKIIIGGGSAGAITSLMQGCSNIEGARPKVILNFWGGLLDNAGNFIDATAPGSIIDASDPPIFTVHGTNDTVVEFENAVNLCAKLNQPEINIPYKLFTLAYKPHGPWSTVFSPRVDGKTILEHSLDFSYEHLDLGPVPPVAENLPQNKNLRIGFDSNGLVIHWKGVPGKSYDLLSNPTLDAPPNQWAIYSEMVTIGQTPPFNLIYSSIPSGGNSTVVVNPFTPPAESARFFAVRESNN